MNDVNQSPLAAYKEEVAQYTKKDTNTALLYAIYLAMLALGTRFLAMEFGLRDIDGIWTFWQGQIINSFVFIPLFLVPAFVIVKKKGQGIGSLGLHLKDWKKALFVGILFFIVPLLLHDGLIPGLRGGWQMQSVAMLIWLLVYWGLMAFYEDVIFIGYIQTRIYGRIKGDRIAILAGAFIFAVVHWPSLVMASALSGTGFGVSFLGELAMYTAMWMILYSVLNLIFRELRSLIPVTLFHAGVNLAVAGVLWQSAYEGGLSAPLSYGIIIGVVLVVTGFLERQKKRGKLA